MTVGRIAEFHSQMPHRDAKHSNYVAKMALANYGPITE
jgi:hypothetical protein